MRGVFWADWSQRLSGEKRSLGRARELAGGLGVLDPGRPVLTVVGSKGKGTAATYASACLTAAGLGVVTVTSPGLRGVKDRIRYNGRSIAEEELTGLAERVGAARDALAVYEPGAGYLSPSGLFIVAGVLHGLDQQADVLVLEAGMGGLSDEVSLFSPTVLAITEIFGEHLGQLGDTPAEIAKDKAGVVTSDTEVVVSLLQDMQVSDVLERTVAVRSGGKTAIDYVESGADRAYESLPAPGLSRRNAELGCVAARRLMEQRYLRPASSDRLNAVLSSVELPGRCSWHDVPGTGVRLLADAAISRAGLAAALSEARRHWDVIDHVLVCLPDHKDVDGAIKELGDLPVTYLRLRSKPRLAFTHDLPAGWSVADVEDVDKKFLAKRGRHIVAIGTGYFISRVLNLIDADTQRLFLPTGT